MNCTAILLIASSLLGQAEAGDATAEKPEVAAEVVLHETLTPLAPLLGTWRSVRKNGLDEVIANRVDTFRTLHNGRAASLEWEERTPDGEYKMSASYIFYFDGAERKLKFMGTSSGGFTETGTLETVDGSELQWHVVFTYASGNQCYYKFKSAVSKDGKTLTYGWTRTSGSGLANAGPFEHERVTE